MRSDLEPDITPETHPDHHTVGEDFMGWSIKHEKAARYYCRSHDRSGYNMVNRADPDDDKNVSERAIGRTYHMILDYGDGCEFSAWGRCLINKQGEERDSLISPLT